MILDEPTTGLDPNQIVEMRRLIREIGKTKTVILSTHILSEVQVTCDRVLIIDKGALVADGTVEEIIAQSQSHLHWKVVVSQNKVQLTSEQIQQLLLELEGVEQCLMLKNIPDGELGFTVVCKGDIRSQLFTTIVQHGLILLELSPYKDDLESVFHRLTEGE